jgi:hypothetical protein
VDSVYYSGFSAFRDVPDLQGRPPPLRQLLRRRSGGQPELRPREVQARGPADADQQ